MKYHVNKIGTILVIAGFSTVLGITTKIPLVAEAAVKMHKVKALPATFRGTWYTKKASWSNKQTHKISSLKVSGKKFGNSKYRYQHDPNATTISSLKFFTPFKVSGSGVYKNTLYLMNGVGINTIRRTTIKGKSVLIRYNEQSHSKSFTIYTKAKHSSIQKNNIASEPFGMTITSHKKAVQNKKFYQAINPNVKKYLGKAFTREFTKGNKFSHSKDVHFTCYSAMKHFSHIVKY